VVSAPTYKASDCPGECHTCQYEVGKGMQLVDGVCHGFCKSDGYCVASLWEEPYIGVDCHACGNSRSSQQFWALDLTAKTTAKFVPVGNNDVAQIESIEYSHGTYTLESKTYGSVHQDFGGNNGKRRCRNYGVGADLKASINGQLVRVQVSQVTLATCSELCDNESCAFFSYSANQECYFVPGRYRDSLANQDFGKYGSCVLENTAAMDIATAWNVYKATVTPTWKASYALITPHSTLPAADLGTVKSTGEFKLNRREKELENHILVVTKVIVNQKPITYTDRFWNGIQKDSDKEIWAMTTTVTPAPTPTPSPDDVPGVPQCDGKWTLKDDGSQSCTADDGTVYRYGSSC